MCILIVPKRDMLMVTPVYRAWESTCWPNPPVPLAYWQSDNCTVCLISSENSLRSALRSLPNAEGSTGRLFEEDPADWAGSWNSEVGNEYDVLKVVFVGVFNSGSGIERKPLPCAGSDFTLPAMTLVVAFALTFSGSEVGRLGTDSVGRSSGEKLVLQLKEMAPLVLLLLCAQHGAVHMPLLKLEDEREADGEG